MSDWSERTLCNDGACIGTINEKGICSICGKPLDTRQNLLQEEAPSKILGFGGVHIYYHGTCYDPFGTKLMSREAAFNKIRELIRFIDDYLSSQDSNRHLPQVAWDRLTVLYSEVESIIPETLRACSQGVNSPLYENRTYLGQLRTQLVTVMWELDTIPKQMIIDALNKANQSHKAAAELLGISRHKLRNKIKEYDLEPSTCATLDLRFPDRYFAIQPDKGGQISFQRDNSYLWSGTRNLTGRELCINGPSTVLYHREVFEWISEQFADLILSTKVVLREDKHQFPGDHYFEIVARRVVGLTELEVVDLPEVFRVAEFIKYLVIFPSSLWTSFRARFPAALIGDRFVPVFI